MGKLMKGDMAPDFALMDQNGNLMKSSDFRGKKLLLYFYPKALTSGCTAQAREVSTAREALAVQGIEAVGISPDMPEVQKKFDNKHELNFPLLSDADHSVSDAYGVWGEEYVWQDIQRYYSLLVPHRRKRPYHTGLVQGEPQRDRTQSLGGAQKGVGLAV